jgi:hypothetical protein
LTADKNAAAIRQRSAPLPFLGKGCAVQEFEQWVAKARGVSIEREIERRGIKLKRNGLERVGACPKCGGDDRFAINIKKQLFNCRGCGMGGDVIELVQHLDNCGFIGACAKLAGEPPPKGNGKDGGEAMTIVAAYDYTDETGNVLFQSCRFEPKDFRQRRSDGKGGWEWKVRGVRQVPYRLPELIKAIAGGKIIAIVEGEKDVDNLWKLGVAATTNAMGAGKWKSELNQHFSGGDVVLIPDNDDAGYRHINEVGAQLSGVAKRLPLLAPV